MITNRVKEHEKNLRHIHDIPSLGKIYNSNLNFLGNVHHVANPNFRD